MYTLPENMLLVTPVSVRQIASYKQNIKRLAIDVMLTKQLTQDIILD